MISYTKFFNSNRKLDVQTVSFDEIDAWDSYDFESNGMNELLNQAEYRRLYFDFDDMKTQSDVNEVMSWLNEISIVFGRVCYAGYTTDESIDDACIAYINATEGYHTISVHAVFPDTCMNNDEMVEIFTSGEYNISRFVDKKVYKATGKQQLLRHPYSPKMKSQDDIRPVGFDFLEYDKMPKPSELVATCDGHERKVTRDQWMTVFTKQIVSDDNAIESLIDAGVADADADFDSLYANTDDALSKEMFESLYKGFEGLQIHGDAEKTDVHITLFPLFSALYACRSEIVDDDDVQDALDFIKENADLTDNAKSKWSEKRKQAKNNDKCTGPGALFNYLKKFNHDYYTSNIVPKIPKKKVVIESKFDLKDSFTINDIRRKGATGEYQINNNPEKLDYNTVLSDLRRVMIVVDFDDGLYVWKERDSKNNKMTLKYTSRQTAFNRLKDMKLGTETDAKGKVKNVTAFDVYNSSTNNASFYKNSVCFYSENPEDFSYFQGYKYNIVRNDSLIELFNNHIKQIWCKNDERLYHYVQSWFATVIQSPTARTCTALVVKGTEGTGKNTVTDVWSELLAGYANGNVSDVDSVVGKFNSRVENKKLLVLNEMDSAELSPAGVFNRLKKLITEPTIDINEKNLKVRDDVQNVANVVILSNEFNPVKISSHDRRYCILTPSDDVVGDRKYFDALYATMKTTLRRDAPYRTDFLEALQYFYMNYNVDIDLADIPETFERNMAKQANKGAIESFVEENCVELSGDGIAVEECFEMFKTFAINNNFKSNYKKNSFKGEMSKYCRFDSDGKPSKYKGVRVYRFTEMMIKQYASLAVTDADVI